MSRINTAASKGESARSDNGTGEEPTMFSGIRKSRRSKAKASKSAPSSTTTASATGDDHPYLGDQEKSAIESWNNTVPKKSTRPKIVPEEQDPVIQAYLEAKLSLFRNAGLNSPGNQDARSVSSTQS